MIAERRGGAYEAALADLFLADAERLMEGLEGEIDRETILALEPLPHAVLDEEACEEAYLAIADMIDMRMPFTFGHSRAVAALADAAGKHMGLPASDIRDTPLGGLHPRSRRAVGAGLDLDEGRSADLARDRRGAASSLPWRACAGRHWAGRARPSRRLVLRHHERLDGSGYHRGVRGPDLSPAARILAAAEAFQTAQGSEAPPGRAERCGRGRKAPRRRQGRQALPRRRGGGPRLRRPSLPAGQRPSAWRD